MKNRLNLFVTFLVTAFSVVVLIPSCSDKQDQEKITFLETRTYTAEDSVVDQYPRTKGDAHGGSYFSKTEGLNQYGMGCLFTINDSLLTKDLRVIVDFWGRVSQANGGCSYAVALHDGPNMVSWNDIDMKKHIKEPNKWVHVVDSVTIPGSLINKSGMIVKNFAYNHNAPGLPVVFDSDDLQITFKSVQKMLAE